MTSLFKHASYAEDQPNSHAILYLHVIRAAAMAGSFGSLLTAPLSLLVSRYRYATPFTVSSSLSRLLIHSGRGLVIGAILGVVATTGRMVGKEEIEWQDRAWRLQENKGEEDTDIVAFNAAVTGSIIGGFSARRGQLSGLSIRGGVLGGAGLGMASGVGYMISTFTKGRQPV